MIWYLYPICYALFMFLCTELKDYLSAFHMQLLIPLLNYHPGPLITVGSGGIRTSHGSDSSNFAIDGGDLVNY